MNGVKKTGFQNQDSGNVNTKTVAGKTIVIHTQNNFQAALNRVKERQFKEKKTDNIAPAPAPMPSNTTAPSSAPSVGGFASSANNSTGGTLRGNMGAVGSGGFRDNRGQERVEQELSNQLIQSGLQAQVLKNNSSSGQDNS